MCVASERKRAGRAATASRSTQTNRAEQTSKGSDSRVWNLSVWPQETESCLLVGWFERTWSSESKRCLFLAWQPWAVLARAWGAYLYICSSRVIGFVRLTRGRSVWLACRIFDIRMCSCQELRLCIRRWRTGRDCLVWLSALKSINILYSEIEIRKWGSKTKRKLYKNRIIVNKWNRYIDVLYTIIFMATNFFLLLVCVNKLKIFFTNLDQVLSIVELIHSDHLVKFKLAFSHKRGPDSASSRLILILVHGHLVGVVKQRRASHPMLIVEHDRHVKRAQTVFWVRHTHTHTWHVVSVVYATPRDIKSTHWINLTRQLLILKLILYFKT